MIHWMTTRATDGKTEAVESFSNMEVALDWLRQDVGDPCNKWVSYFYDDDGNIQAVAIYQGDELAVTFADGRYITLREGGAV